MKHCVETGFEGRNHRSIRLRRSASVAAAAFILAASLGSGSAEGLPRSTSVTIRAATSDPINQGAVATAQATRRPQSSYPVGGSTSAGWIVHCGFAHTLSDDPIKFPGQPGASHSHDFLGALDAKASSSEASMRSGGTTCGLPEDTAGYWVATLSANGTPVHPVDGAPGVGGAASSQNVYYRNPDGMAVQPIPAGLKMIVGNAMAMSVAENPLLGHEIWFGCSDNSISAKLTAPPARCPEGIITLHVHFPNCWDGTNLDSPDHISHMAWSHDKHCDPAHPVVIPEVTLRLEYPVGASTGAITLASGPTYTVHGDFWNTWDQARLATLTATCINAGIDCGKFR